MMNLSNILKNSAFFLSLAALLPTTVACSTDEVASVPSVASVSNQRVQVRFHALKHGNANSIDKDKVDQEDYVKKVMLRTIGEAFSVDNSKEVGVATWDYSGIILSPGSEYQFVANVHTADAPIMKATQNSTGETFTTANYLRGFNGLPANLPLLMTATLTGTFQDQGKRVYQLDNTVAFKRVFSRFSFQTYPLPEGYIMKKVSVERIPAKFLLIEDNSSTALSSSYGYINGLVLWQSNSASASQQTFATWAKSKWNVANDPHPDMYLSGHFYLPPCKVASNVDPFDKNTDGGMPLMRFVFTDNQNRTFVRLYRLGNSTTGTGRGNINYNTDYDIRINLLGPFSTRADNNAVLRAFDEGGAKAAYVN